LSDSECWNAGNSRHAETTEVIVGYGEYFQHDKKIRLLRADRYQAFAIERETDSLSSEP
jgi:hypothetical protein